MKKNLLFLFALICSMSLFTACNDDDDKVTLQDLSKEYSGENLSLKLDDAVVAGKTVKFEAKSGMAGVITLNDIVSELPSLSVDLTLTAANDGYSFEGSKEVTGYVVSVSGTLTNDSKLTVNIITKGWELEKSQYTAENLALKVNGKEVADQSVTFNITSPTEANLVLKNLFEGVEQDFTVPVKMIIATTRAENAAKVYSFKGEDESVSGYVIMASGTIATDGQLTLDVQAGGWKTLKESYSYADENLVFVGGYTNDDAKYSHTRVIKIQVDSESDGTKATLTFNDDYISDLKLKDLGSVDVTLTREGTVYKISGEKKYNDFLNFIIEGTVTGETLDLSVTAPKYTQLKKDLVGVWNLSTAEGGADTSFKFATKSGSLTVPAEIANLIPAGTPGISEILGQPIPDATINVLVGSLLSQYAVNLKTIEFTENTNKDGYYKINITYTKDNAGSPVEELKDLLHYNWTKDGLYIGFDFSKVMELVNTPAPTVRSAQVELLADGIPFKCDIADGKLKLSIDKDTVSGTVNYIYLYLSELAGLVDYGPEVFAQVLAGMFKISEEAALAIAKPFIDIMPTLQTALPAVLNVLNNDIETLDASISFVK